MLLQLVEPGATPLPHDTPRSLAVGIDLGTTNSSISYVREGQPVIIHGDLDSGLLPSAVYYKSDNEPVVGRAALDAMIHDSHNVITSIKRQFVQNLNNQSAQPTAHGMKTPIHIAADILKALKDYGQHHSGQTIDEAVITVPAYFDDGARAATREAAEHAGFKVLRLINEPTAAALAYGLEKNVHGYYAVYDLGGGTFDFSLLKLDQGIFQVLATGGNTYLGGDDFDQVLLTLLITDRQIPSSLIPQYIKPLLQAIRLIKQQLSHDHIINEEIVIDHQAYPIFITQERYHHAIQSLINETLDVCKTVLIDACIDKTIINGVIMVGGATRTPAVQHAVRDYFEQQPLVDINPDEVVARGAAIQAHALTVGSDHLLLDVNPLSLGIETMGGLVEKIIPRNSPIPISKAQEFTTFKDGQTALAIHIVQGERELIKDCRSLGRFELRNIPSMVAGAARVRVTFNLDADNILSVSAMETSTGQQQRIVIKPTEILSLNTLNDHIVNSLDEADNDLEQRLLNQAKVAALRLLNAVESACNSDSQLLTNTELKSLQKECNLLQHIVKVGVREDIIKACQDLENSSQILAERRVNNIMKTALQGKLISDVQRNIGNS